jgi:hypothetical protein
MMERMTGPSDDQRDIRKVRIGLAMITAVVVITIVGLVIVESALGKAIMFAVAATAIVRAFLLVRWLKRG